LINIFEDIKSGKDMERDGFKQLVEVLEKNPAGVSMIISTKIDRMGRSLSDLINFSKSCEQKKIDLVFTQSNIDTTTSEARMFFYLMGVFAEYERERLIERTSEGRTRYLSNGGKIGAVKKVLPIEDIRKALDEGVPKIRLAKKYKVSITTLKARLAGK
jgi:DNA invertase Pin-like site-specific DNA recombinase